MVFMACREEVVPSYLEGIQFCDAAYKKLEEENRQERTIILRRPSCLEGFQLPEFKALTYSGDSLHSESLMGKPSVVNLWFVGCPPCEAEVPGLNSLAEKYQDKVNFVAIGRNNPKYLVEFLEENKWGFVHINDYNETLILDDFQFSWGYPTTFIADEKGIIRKAFSGGRTDSTAYDHIIEQIEPTLVSLLGE